MDDGFEILVQDEGNVVARERNVVVQVRRGVITIPLLDRIESQVRLLRAATSGPVGAIAVVEEGASLASGEVRMRQAALVRALVADPRTRMASVVLGQSVGTRAVRTVMRVLLMGAPHLHTAASIEDGAAWLAQHVETHSAPEIVRTVARARRALG